MIKPQFYWPKSNNVVPYKEFVGFQKSINSNKASNMHSNDNIHQQIGNKLKTWQQVSNGTFLVHYIMYPN